MATSALTKFNDFGRSDWFVPAYESFCRHDLLENTLRLHDRANLPVGDDIVYSRYSCSGMFGSACDFKHYTRA